jgi:DnaJ-class molecular chaperone
MSKNKSRIINIFTKRCGSCSGNGSITTNEKLKIKIPNGLDEGQFLKLQGKGDFVKGMYGNLVIRVNIVPQDNFEKMGNDLVYNAYFNLDDLSKDTFDITHPSSTISVNIPKDFDSSKPLRVKGKGFNGGDLFIKLFVKFTRIN